MKRSEQFNELVTALAKAQGQIIGAPKDAENPHFKSEYATLDSVWDVCRKPLSENGLSVIQSPIITQAGSVLLTTLLAHNSGQWFENELELFPKDASPQSVGSAITYARRYALMAMVGIAPSDDDDANGAQPPRPALAPSGTRPPVVATVAAVKKEPAPAAPVKEPTKRQMVSAEIKALQQKLNIPATELAEWVTNKFGKTSRDLTIEEMVLFRDELSNEMKGK